MIRHTTTRTALPSLSLASWASRPCIDVNNRCRSTILAAFGPDRPNVTRCAPATEPLESRRLCAGISLDGGILTLTGTVAGDTISVSLTAGPGTGFPFNLPSTFHVTATVNDLTREFDDVDAILILGFAGNDNLSAFLLAPTTIRGGSGNDTIATGESNDVLHGDAGHDTIRAGIGINLITGGYGDDIIECDNGIDNVNAGHGADLVTGGGGRDTLLGGDGNDTLTGNAGADHIDGGLGDDRLNGSGSNDYLTGAEGNDRIFGQQGNDHLEGGGGIDRLFGGDGNDLLVGGASNDKLYGEAGADRLFGGTGDDRRDDDPLDTHTDVEGAF